LLRATTRCSAGSGRRGGQGEDRGDGVDLIPAGEQRTGPGLSEMVGAEGEGIRGGRVTLIKQGKLNLKGEKTVGFVNWWEGLGGDLDGPRLI